MTQTPSDIRRDHGGRLDNAIERFGGVREDWTDLSTGIAPFAYPLPALSLDAWRALPDQAAMTRVVRAARRFWDVPDVADVLPVPGASIAIAQIPRLAPKGTVRIGHATYNEHAAAFGAHGWTIVQDGSSNAHVVVHPNNPDGHLIAAEDVQADLTVIDESFCDACPEESLVHLTSGPRRVIVLKSFGKFWGLAGLRLGFAIGRPDDIKHLAQWIGPWPVSGPALEIGAAALEDPDWAEAQRARLTAMATALDSLIVPKHGALVGGTSLFRLYDIGEVSAFADRLAAQHILVRTFPYNDRWVRFGVPDADGIAKLKAAL